MQCANCLFFLLTILFDNKAHLNIFYFLFLSTALLSLVKGSEEHVSVPVKDIEAFLRVNIDEDAKPDKLVLADETLYIYLTSSKKTESLRFHYFNHNHNKIEQQKNGSISISNMYHGVGRDMIDTKTTLAYRNGKLIVAGYDYTYDDKHSDHTDKNISKIC